MVTEPNSEALLSVEDLSVGLLRHGQPPLRLVENVTLKIHPGECVALVGESGSGKTLTALSIIRLLPPGIEVLSGAVRFAKQDLLSVDQAQLQHIRGKQIGFVFQDPLTALNPVLTIGDQITEVLTWHEGLGRFGAWAKAQKALELVRMPEARARMHSYPHELSGGMRQRALIAMAVVCQPTLLIADEPTTALDVTVQAEVMSMMDELREELGLAMLFITHDLRLTAERANRVVVMYAGQVVENAPAEMLFAAPYHPYTKALLRCLGSGDGESRDPCPIPGEPPRADMPPGCRFNPRCSEIISECSVIAPPLTPVEGNRWVRCLRYLNPTP